MLALAFLNPLLLVGLPLCAVPIVIHLLNRRRFHRVPWAAMEYLLAAMKRNRKRLRMEQWLVLLLRTLAVLLLVALVSRPQLGGGGILSSRTHHVVVLDDSASMTQRSGSTSLFEKAQDRVRTLVDELASRRSGDVLSIVRTSKPTSPDAWAQRIGPETSRRVTTLQQGWIVSDGAPDLGAVLQATVKRASEVADAARTEYYVVSDRRAQDWATEDDKPKPSVLTALATMRKNEKLSLHPVGGQHHDLAIADVRVVDRMVTAGVPAALAVEVQNFGLDPTAPTTVAVEVDGASRVVLPVQSLSPGERIAVPISHTFGKAGFSTVRAQLEATEQFPLDDRRTLAIEVRDKSRVLLVDGEPDEDDGETFYLQAAMEMAESGIEPMVVTVTALEETDLQPFDFVWLCNAPPPSAATCQRLEAWVAAGGGLAITCGSQVDTTRYNELLWRDGKGVLPLPLAEIAGDPDKPEGAVLVGKSHPICAGVAEVMEILVANVVLVKRWLGVVEDGQQSASVVIRTHDAEGPPLLVTRTFPGGGGEVALFTISADKFWSNLPSTDLFVVLCNQIHRCGARRHDTGRENLLPDGVYRVTLDPAAYRPDVTVRAVADGGDEHTYTATEATPGSGPLALSLPMHELLQLGAYEVVLSRHDGVPEKRLLARNPSLAESRLVPFPQSSFIRLYPAELHDRVAFVDETHAADAGSAEGELWPLLAAALVAGLLLESLLAWRFGRR